MFNADRPIGLGEWPWVQFAASRLQLKPGTALWKYWTRGKGAAKWMGAAHPWTTLRALLIKYVGKQAAGLTTNIMLATPAGRALFKKSHQHQGAH